MDALVDYSARNVADLPNGAALLSKYPDDPLQKFRVWADVRLDTQRGNPSLWLFLLIVVASLGGVLICLSFFLHWRARHRRARVRRMIISGEISLDVLGIRKATVPKDDIDKMPLYIYVCDTPGAQPTTPAPDEDHDEYIKDFIDPVTRKPIPEKTFEALSQPSCPICLDDYRSHTTVVRTLPCNHIFHPECIDKFLSSNSCLCPMCKSSALPKGYCPPLITNQMVRRVRTARLREQTRVKPRSDQYVARVLYKWRSRKLRRLDQRQGVRMEILRQNATQASLARQRRLERLQAAAAANAANAEGADVAAGTPGTPETAGAVELERRPELEGMTRAERGEVRRAEIEAQLTGGEGDPGEQRSSNRSACKLLTTTNLPSQT